MPQFTDLPLKKIAVYASGGDAPGMNAAIRAVVRTALSHSLQVTGIVGGYSGILNNQFRDLEASSVANIIQRGGSVLKAGRCPEFLQESNRKKAADILRRLKIEALVCVGGDGSYTGAHHLWLEQKIPIVGVPGTIDNDIFGTDFTIGFDTAVNTALDAIDRVRDTAASHDRLFIVEVMGRDSGFIAIESGLAGGAEDIFIPEHPMNVDETVNQLKRSQARGKMSSILIAAEGQKPGRAYDLAEAIRKKSGLEAKVCILGHIQRGGTPTAADRILASRLGAAAVTTLMQGYCDVAVGVQGSQVVRVDLGTVLKNKKHVDPELINLVQILAR